ncbi:MAG: hypothetical protein A2W25_09395 [candidate division Zixibacteria bacterium RBG_16_53_22]|nr:MAG: hypothetical protein A2W25_09395 [candidate division Zixibacteria bacterium RBG_16_53_22]
MKIAFFSGCVEYSVCLANSLRKDCKLDFIYNGNYVRFRDESILDLLESGIRKIELSRYRIRDYRNFWNYRLFAVELRHYDIIHFQEGDIWFSLNRSLFKNVPLVLTVHDPTQHAGLPFINRMYQDYAQRWIVTQSDSYIVHGQNMKNDLARNFSVPLERINVIPHGEFSFYKKWRSEYEPLLKPKKGKKRLLFFGEVRRNKGLEYLIKAEPLISSRYDNYTICIAGRFSKDPGNDFEHYRKMMVDTSRYEVINRYIANNEVAEIFESSDIVVLPYMSASQSGILALAFGFGKPVVSTDTGSIGEVLEHGQTGLLVSAGDTVALADAISTLLNDDERCTFFAANAAAVAQTRLNWDTIGKQTVDIYRSILR